ncbi:MAG: hypothetical protein KBT11_11135 [Treponema sp.]|nr:hypothetical protein [Candidatus Treponema equifaecale]
MFRHPFRKSLGLTILYSIIIIGIFVLQFRNESVLSRNIGQLSISLAQTQEENGSMSLKNTLNVNFKGIAFSADEVYPAVLKSSGEDNVKNLILVSFEQPSPLSYKFNFTEETSIIFAVSDTSSNASLSISVTLPEDAEELYLPYKPASGFSVTEKSRNRLQLNSKNLAYTFSASSITDEAVAFTPKNQVAYYNIYNPTTAFSFASIDPDMVISQKSLYEQNISQLRTNLVSAVSAGIKNSQGLSEKAITAYVAELASQGRYTEAVNQVPDSFKKGNKRTYLSAPYFNTLDSMYPSLTMHNENMAGIIDNAISTKSLNVFTVEGIADYLNILPSIKKIRDMLSLPVQNLETEGNALSLSQATGILRVYLRLSELHSNYAELLAPAVSKCVSEIEGRCNLNDTILSLKENDLPISTQLTLETGSALLQLGEFNSSEEYKRAGYALINTVLAGTTLDANALAEAYPVLVANTNYPHTLVLQRTETSTIWAWTCANGISYSRQKSIATLSIKNPKGSSHYAIICGIQPFNDIEIYNLSFHSDARFESYNSSGFTYKSNGNALLLKTRHKAETEVVKLFYGPKPAPKVEVPKPAEKPVAPVPAESAGTAPAPATTE